MFKPPYCVSLPWILRPYPVPFSNYVPEQDFGESAFSSILSRLALAFTAQPGHDEHPLDPRHLRSSHSGIRGLQTLIELTPDSGVIRTPVTGPPGRACNGVITETNLSL
jgi:hypothetical protein